MFKKENVLGIILVILLSITSFGAYKATTKLSFINGQVNGYIIGCKHTGVPTYECTQRSRHYETWLKCDQYQNKCN